MILKHEPRLGILALFLVAAAALILGESQAKPPQDQAQQSQDQGQQSQDQSQSNQQQKKKKKGGLFGGLKSVTGESSEQTSATSTAGSKSVGEGAKISEVTPNAADREQVTKMENYSIPQGDLKKFQESGQLKPKQ